MTRTAKSASASAAITASSGAGLRSVLRAKSRARREALGDIQAADKSLRRNGDPILDLQIEMLSLGDLQPATRRVKKANPAQLARVIASIQRFGLVAPVLVDRDGGIIHGHAIVDAARALELAAIPCVRLEHLSSDERRLLSITLNRLAETGEWDSEALTLELRDLSVLDEALTALDQTIVEDRIRRDPSGQHRTCQNCCRSDLNNTIRFIDN